MSIDDRRTDQGDDDFERWLRQNAPTFRPPDEHREQLRLVLKSKFVRNQRTSRIRRSALSVAGLLVVAFSIANFGILGGNSSDLVPAGETADGTRIFKPVVGDQRYGGADRTESHFETIHEKTEARERELVSVSGWTIEGRTYLEGVFEYEVDGETSLQMQTIVLPWVSEMSESTISFRDEHEEGLLEIVRTGRAERMPDRTINVDGRSVVLRRWQIRHPRLGEIIYWEG